MPLPIWIEDPIGIWQTRAAIGNQYLDAIADHGRFHPDALLLPLLGIAGSNRRIVHHLEQHLAQLVAVGANVREPLGDSAAQMDSFALQLRPAL